jgi:sigma-B regulation protein RsbU (phosphoserine phosphatase)
MAREVQAQLIPRATPQRAGWDFAARWQPAREVAGDYYDFHTGHADGSVGLVIADVTDKGMPAALFMALTRTIVRASAAAAWSPAEAITQSNRLICADSMNSMFVTLFYGRLDPATGDLTYVNAGHNPPLWYQAGRDDPTLLTRTGMALGLHTAAAFDHRTVQLHPGDLMLLYTDGVTDAMDASGQPFGLARVKRALADHRHLGAAEILDALDRSLLGHVGDSQPYDDITLVLIKRQ